jgi:hypothetical protein
MLRQLTRGALAGAAGVTALNAATYADMALRGRPASRTPEESVERISGKAGVDLPGGPVERENRVSGVGALSGLGVGVTVGAAYGLARSWGLHPGRGAATVLLTLAAMVAGNGPLALLRVSDPRDWAPTDWAADVLPHLAYGVVTAATYDS